MSRLGDTELLRITKADGKVVKTAGTDRYGKSGASALRSTSSRMAVSSGRESDRSATERTAGTDPHRPGC